MLLVAGLLLIVCAVVFAPQFLADPPLIPNPIAEGMEAAVKRVIGSARADVVANPSSEPAWRRFANLLDSHDLNEEAVIAYTHVLALNPGDSASRYNYGLLLEYVGRSDEALIEFETVVAARPTDSAPHHRIGELHAREGRQAEAEAAFRRALEISPDSQISQRGLAIALNALGKTGEAIALLEPLAAAVPADRGTTSSLVQAYQRNGQPEKAAALNSVLPPADTLALRDPIRHAVVSLAVDSKSCIDRAKEFERSSQFQLAIQAFVLAAEGAPESAAIPDWIGRNYMRLGQPRLAIPHFDRSVALDPGRANAYFNRGSAYESTGNRTEAIGDYRRAATIDPEHKLAKARLQALGAL